jgi:hypothetical protein
MDHPGKHPQSDGVALPTGVTVGQLSAAEEVISDGATWLVAERGVGAMFEQKFDDFGVESPHQGYTAMPSGIDPLGIWIGSAAQKGVDRGPVLAHDRQHERSVATTIDSIHLGPCFDQGPNQLGTSAGHSGMQGRFAILCRGLHVRTLFDQFERGRLCTVQYRLMQFGATLLVTLPQVRR